MPGLLERLKVAFKDALELEGDITFEVLAYGETEGWDSVAHMGLIASIESGFDIMLETDDVVDMSSFPKAVEIVSKYVESD